MNSGILYILAAALLCSFCYIFSARFLLHHNSPIRMLILAQTLMMVMSLPALPFLFPFAEIQHGWRLAGLIAIWVMVFFIGQGCFFRAQGVFEASRLASLLGLKIIVLAVIYICFEHKALGLWQWVAVFLAASAGMLFNWSGSSKASPLGWLFLGITLICYSTADISETHLVLATQETGHGLMKSAFGATFLLYAVLGLVSLPIFFWMKPTKAQIIDAFPYALFWLASQILLLAGFAIVKPVFGNVILALRGVFSVLMGLLLARLGMGALDTKDIPPRKWIQRGVAALLMIVAIALYSGILSR